MLYSKLKSLFFTIAILIGLWVLIIEIINPAGEFMINDDWAFVRTLQILISEGRFAPTGWGPSWAPGGPALLTHLIWARIFTYFWGFSLTGLRVSVLIIGILGSVALLVLLKMSKAGVAEAFWATLTLVFNPLFLSQSFTFMTDVTFTSMTIFALLFLEFGVEHRKIYMLVIGLLFALLAILTRQLGIVIAIAFVLLCFIHPAGRAIGKWKASCLALGLAIIPWVAYEYYLSVVGSTPLSQHLVLQEMFLYPQVKGFPDYFMFLFEGLFTCGLTYVGFLISPVLALKYRLIFSWRPFRYFAVVFTGLFILFEAALIGGIIDAPVKFCLNVIFNFGLGPVLLKDVYIMGVQRVPALPAAWYYLAVYWAILAEAGCLQLMFRSLMRLSKAIVHQEHPDIAFLPALSLLAGLMYLGIIVLSGFHDRYLIAVCVFFIVWLISDRDPSDQPVFTSRALFAGAVPLVVMIWFSVSGVHDFMALKRSQKEALDYLTQDIRVNPCNVDGGFEFNGYHCYDPNFQPKEGLSWWWVHKEDYVITLGPLPGYDTVGTFPFKRLCGPPAAIHILKPVRQDGN